MGTVQKRIAELQVELNAKTDLAVAFCRDENESEPPKEISDQIEEIKLGLRRLTREAKMEALVAMQPLFMALQIASRQLLSVGFTVAAANPTTAKDYEAWSDELLEASKTVASIVSRLTQ